MRKFAMIWESLSQYWKIYKDIIWENLSWCGKICHDLGKFVMGKFVMIWESL